MGEAAQLELDSSVRPDARHHCARDPKTGEFVCFLPDRLLGLVTARGDTEAAAIAAARRRWRLRWLGVEWPGLVLPAAARSPAAGQIALNGCRFALWRQLGEAERTACWVMLNPSTADHDTDDATLRQIRRYSLDWGYGWLTVGNLWPLRATRPRDLVAWIPTCSRSRLAENERFVCRMAARADLVMVAWGAHGGQAGRGEAMLATLASHGIHDVHALAMTRDGQPRHPLRLSSTLQPRPLRALQKGRATA